MRLIFRNATWEVRADPVQVHAEHSIYRVVNVVYSRDHYMRVGAPIKVVFTSDADATVNDVPCTYDRVLQPINPVNWRFVKNLIEALEGSLVFHAEHKDKSEQLRDLITTTRSMIATIPKSNTEN